MKKLTIGYDFDSDLEKFDPHKDYYKACEELKMKICLEFNFKTKQEKRKQGILSQPFEFSKDYYKVYIKLLELLNRLKAEQEELKRSN